MKRLNILANLVKLQRHGTLIPRYLRYLLLTFSTIYGKFFEDYVSIFSIFLKKLKFYLAFFVGLWTYFCHKPNLGAI